MNINKIIAIIPARGGSKGIPKKNIVDLNWKPLLAHTIEAAIWSGCFDKICVTTDSSEIKSLAKKYDIDVIERPNNLAEDNSKTIDAVLHVLDQYKEKNLLYDIVVLLQPTSPFRTDSHIKNAVDTYRERDSYRSLVSFCEMKDHPYKCFFLLENNTIKSIFWDEYLSMPRQLLPKTIRQNGAIYINKTEDLIRFKNFFTEPIFPFMMEEISSIDIDTKIDLQFAEFCINKK